MTLNDHHKLIEDGAIAAGAVTLPYWTIYLNDWVAFGITLATFVLIILRIILAIKEWRDKYD